MTLEFGTPSASMIIIVCYDCHNHYSNHITTILEELYILFRRRSTSIIFANYYSFEVISLTCISCNPLSSIINIMRSMQKRKRTTVPTIAIVAIVLTTAMLTSTSSNTSVVLAFVAVSDTTSFSSTTRHVMIPNTLLHATNDNDASDQEVKLTIAKVTDEDVNAHLNPPGDRPVLLDLYAPHWKVRVSIVLSCEFKRSMLYCAIML